MKYVTYVERERKRERERERELLDETYKEIMLIK